MIRLKFGHLVIRATLLEMAGFFILLPGLTGIYTHSMRFWDALLLIIIGLIFMQDRYYVRWVIKHRQSQSQELTSEASSTQDAQKHQGEP